MRAEAQGYLELSWAPYSPDKWDWVGVYASVTKSDAQFVDGAWQWATYASPFVTPQIALTGYQARYLRWDAAAGAYRSLLRTAPFPGRVEAHQHDMARWMKGVPNTSVPLSALSLPGTHDSAAWGMYLPATNTQGMSIAAQLRAGIRFLDIRLGVAVDLGLECYHGIVNLMLLFDRVLETVFEFLDEYPSETVVMSIRNEPNTRHQEFVNCLWSQYIEPNASRFLTGDTIPTLRDARGKIVLARRFTPVPTAAQGALGLDFTSWADNSKSFRIQYASRKPAGSTVTAFVQDFYDTADVTAKTQAVDALLTQAVNGSKGDIYLNFSSAVGSYSPYFMAVYVNPSLLATVSTMVAPVRLGWVVMDWPEVSPDLIYEVAVSNLPIRPRMSVEEPHDRAHEPV